MNEDHRYSPRLSSKGPSGLTFAVSSRKETKRRQPRRQGTGTEAHPGNTEARRQPRMRGRRRGRGHGGALWGRDVRTRPWCIHHTYHICHMPCRAMAQRAAASSLLQFNKHLK